MKAKHKLILILAIASPLLTFLLLHSAHSLPFISNDIASYVSFAIIFPLIATPLSYWCFIKKIDGKSGFNLYTENKNKKEKASDFVIISLTIPAFSMLMGWLSVDLFAFPSALLANEQFEEEVKLVEINNAGNLYPRYQSIVFYQNKSNKKLSFLWPKETIKDTYVTSGKVKPGQTILIIGRRWLFGAYIDRLQAPKTAPAKLNGSR